MVFFAKDYSIKSFILSAIVHCTIVAAFAFEFLKNHSQPRVSLVIDAQLIGEVMKEQHHEQKKDSQSHRHAANSKVLHEEHHDSEAQKTPPIYQPLPEIPDDLRFDAFNSYAIARFHIAKDGSVERVELVRACSNPRLNQLLLKTLKNWRFNPNSKTSTQDIRVTFKVE